MNETSKSELRALRFIGDYGGTDTLPNDYVEKLSSFIDRLITEAEGRVHAQAIAAAAAEVLSVSWIPIHLRQDAIKLITRLTRPAAELRARIEVARAVLNETKYIRNNRLDLDEGISFLTAELETQLAALDKETK